MRKLEFNRQTSSTVPIPYYVGGEVDEHFLSFLTARYYYPKQIRNSLDVCLPRTLENISSNVAFLINVFEQEGFSYVEANYETLSKVITALYEDEEWLGSSLKVYAGHWRMFYEYLSKKNVPHNMILPARNELKRKSRKDEHFLSHTASSADLAEAFQETMVPRSYLLDVDDYREKVISMEQWFELQAYLQQEDPVYAVMATVMLQTFLRIGGVFQLPFGPTQKNPRWQRYAQMKQRNKSSQKLNYIKKGQKPAVCRVHLYTMQMVEEDYLSTHYEVRKKLYEEKYIYSKHAKKQGRTVNDTFIWLNKNGTPVSPRELQSVFERASEALGFNVTPHYLRHTGASQILYLYSKKNNITLSVEQSTTIHTWLSNQLGHNRLSTTELYIRTVNRLEAESCIAEILPQALPKNMKDLQLGDEHIEAFQRTVIQNRQFFEGVNYNVLEDKK
jgi:site-specific recombinase XerD